MADRTVLRAGSFLAITGAIVAVLVNVLHPRVGEFEYGGFGYSDAFLQNIVDSSEWVSLHNWIMVAGILLTGGLLAIYRSISAERGRFWAEIGLMTAVVGLVLLIVNMALDGIAMKQVALAWADAPADQKAAPFRIANSLVEVSLAIFALWTFVFWGVTFTMYGIAVSLSSVYPRWLGWVAVVAGITGAAVGIVHAHLGASMLLSNILFALVSITLTVWVLIMGVLMGRDEIRLGFQRIRRFGRQPGKGGAVQAG